jgi:lipopolysaccharide transport system ATP-binding protein
MYLRLAFAVAAHLEPEILLVDEVLAVGDLAFQRKCLGKMGDVTHQGRTILFVTHNLAAVQSLCPRAYLFDHGRLSASGPTQEVVSTYLASIPALGRTPLRHRHDRQGNRELQFTDIQFFAGNRCPVATIQSGDDLQIAVHYTSSQRDVKNVYMAIDIKEPTGQCILSLCNVMVGTEFQTLPPRGRFCCAIQRVPLSPGQYPITLFCRANGDVADWVQQAAVLSVEPGDFFGTGRLPPPGVGGVLVPQNWHVEEDDESGNNNEQSLVV